MQCGSTIDPYIYAETSLTAEQGNAIPSLYSSGMSTLEYFIFKWAAV